MANTIGRDAGRFLALAAQVGLPAFGAVQNIQNNSILQQIAQERLNRLRQQNEIGAQPQNVITPDLQPIEPINTGMDPSLLGFANKGGFLG